MAKLKFTKMHGLGNDFMVIDAVNQPFEPAAAPIAVWADRHRGIGFDQLLVVAPSGRPDADFAYRIFNADGSEAGQCGNGARCFAVFVREKGLSAKSRLTVDVGERLLVLEILADGTVVVDMGQAKLNAGDIPFIGAPAADNSPEYRITVAGGEYVFGCVNMGNPHMVIAVEDLDTAPVCEHGALFESHPLFPERANIGWMQVLTPTHIRLRVFERGVGETQACGTGACAAVVSGIRRGLLSRNEPVRVDLPGGTLNIHWDGERVLMSGAAQTVFEGVVTYGGAA